MTGVQEQGWNLEGGFKSGEGLATPDNGLIDLEKNPVLEGTSTRLLVDRAL
jgi:hypothetical protein